ncbi:MAG: hypothetical protein O9345_16160 [Burkholderiaceae bacterium]|nr:hypothetical protein [Burkholderiales bacterium]MCZ8339660.1 hypothetical protein [Burkholderiaceae bacterium]
MGASVKDAETHFIGLVCRPADEAQKRLGDVVCVSRGPAGCPVARCGAESPIPTYGGVPLNSATFYFGGDKLHSIMLSIKPDDANQLIESIRLKFGDPASDDRTPVQNRMGATFEQREAVWMVAGTRIKVSRYTNSIERGLATITAPGALDHMKANQPSREKRLGDM